MTQNRHKVTENTILFLPSPIFQHFNSSKFEHLFIVLNSHWYRIAHPFSLVIVYECDFDDVLFKMLLTKVIKDLHQKKATDISFHLG